MIDNQEAANKGTQFTFDFKKGGDLKDYRCACCMTSLKRDGQHWRCDNPKCPSRRIGVGDSG